MVGPGGVCVHAGATTHRFEAIEDLNGIRIVLSGHGGPCELTFGGNLNPWEGLRQIRRPQRVIQRGW
ncbi:hypothetical protein AH4AK4_0478 [Aeromonas hydrophila 4AK4]|nr:hypothetical protein AH4AK4_0478 [Aeromonas hydrophila 4AK4]